MNTFTFSCKPSLVLMLTLINLNSICYADTAFRISAQTIESYSLKISELKVDDFSKCTGHLSVSRDTNNMTGIDASSSSTPLYDLVLGGSDTGTIIPEKDSQYISVDNGIQGVMDLLGGYRKSEISVQLKNGTHFQFPAFCAIKGGLHYLVMDLLRDIKLDRQEPVPCEHTQSPEEHRQCVRRYSSTRKSAEITGTADDHGKIIDWTVSQSEVALGF